MAAKVFEELQAAITDWVGIRDSGAANRLPPSVRKDIINMMRRKLARMGDFRFTQKSTTIVLEVGKLDYSLPADWSRPVSLQYQKTGTPPTILEPLPQSEFDIRYPENTAPTNKPPKFFSIFEDKIYIGPHSDGAYTVKVKYIQATTDLVDGSPGNTDAMLTQAWDVLLDLCLGDTTIYTVEDNRAAVFAERAKLAIELLKGEHAANWKRSTATN